MSRVLLIAIVAMVLAAAPTEASAATWIHCLDKAGGRYVAKKRPGKCAHFGRGGTFGGGVNLKGVKWSSWGGRSAGGTATECGFHLPCSNISATIKAYRVRHSHGRRIYTRLRATSRYGTTVVRLATHPHRAY